MALLKLAVRNLRRNRRRTAINFAALVVGVFAMVAMKGFMLGVRQMMYENQTLGTMGVLQVHHEGYVGNVLTAPLTLDMADTPALREKLASTPGVSAVSPRLEFGAQLSTPDLVAPDGGVVVGTSTFFVVTAIDPALERQVTPKRWDWFAAGRGRMFDDATSAVVVVNDDFARGWGARVQAAGAPLPPIEQQEALLTADRDGALNGENVVIAGTFASATPNDRRSGLVPLATAQRLLRMEGRVTEYALALSPGARAEDVQQRLRERLGAGYEVHRWDERLPFFKDWVDMQETVFGIVINVFLLVMLLGIVNSMLMSVLERVREIGTMLAVGMTRRKIVTLFLAEGAVLGVLGGVIGIALGVALTLALHRVGVPIPAPGAKVPSMVRPDIDPVFLVRVALQAAGGATIASLWPAWRASRLRPVEALAHT